MKSGKCIYIGWLNHCRCVLSLLCTKTLFCGSSSGSDFKFSGPVYGIQYLFHTNQSHHFKGWSVSYLCSSHRSSHIQATQHIHGSDWQKFPCNCYGARLTSLRATLFRLRWSRYLPKMKLKLTCLTHSDLIWGALLATSVRQSSSYNIEWCLN